MMASSNTTNTAPGSAGQNVAHTPGLVEALSYTIICLVSLRKNYDERELDLWEDVSKAITQGRSAITASPVAAVMGTAHPAAAPSYAPRNHYIPPPSNPLAPWREDPLGAVALVVTMAILIAAVGVASLI